MPQHSVAIDYSPKAARIAVCEANFRSSELVRLTTVTFEPELTADERWARIRTELPEHIDAVIVGVDPAQTSTRLLSFPMSDVRKIEAAIDFELENQIPYAMEEVATTWHISHRDANSTQVVAAVTQRAPLQEFLAQLARFDLEPRVAVLPGAALAEYVAGHTDLEGPVAVLAMGATMTHLTIVHHDLKFTRTLRVGGDDIDRALAKQFNISLADAKQGKEEEGRVLEEEEVAEARAKTISRVIEESLTPLFAGLSTTFKALPAAFLPQRFLLTGGQSRLAGLPALLSRHFGMPAACLDIAAVAAGALHNRVEAVAPEYALAVALAVAQARHGRNVPLNFRRGSLAFRGDLQMFRGQLIRAGMGLAAVFLIAVAGYGVRYGLISAQEKKINRGFCAATKKAVGREICDPTAALATLRQAPGAASGVVIPSYSASMLYEMLSTVLGKDLDVSFDDLEFRLDGQAGASDRISAKGEASSFETTEQMVMQLKRDPCVQDAEVSKQRKARDSTRVEFNLTVKVSCPSGIMPSTRGAAPSVEAAPSEARPAGLPGAPPPVGGDAAPLAPQPLETAPLPPAGMVREH